MDIWPIRQHSLIFTNNASKNVTINISHDLQLERNETFSAILSIDATEKGVNLGHHEAHITIENDDGRF